MKKILQIVDVKDWAIGTLAKGVMRYNQHLNWKQIAVHPKDLEFNEKIDFVQLEKYLREADIIDCQYWRTLSQLLDRYPFLKDKPIILTHHNEKNLLSHTWPANIIHIAKTRYSETILKENFFGAKIYYIPNSFDHEIFKYDTERKIEEKCVGYVGRIVPWKGLKELARACFELGYPLMLMGKHDKISYYNEIPKEHQDNIRWDYFNCPDDARPDFYRNITIYVGNSGGGREVGTLGFIEALACGVPVVTTPAGLARDIGDDQENMLMVDYDDYDGLKEAIKTLMESQALQARLRKAGWETIRNFNDERMAMQYRKVLNEILYKKDLVSIVIPTTYERMKETKDILNSLEHSSYKDIEAVVIFDQQIGVTDTLRAELGTDYSFPVKVLATGRIGGYNLAIARNLGVVESDGKYILFNDSRLIPAPDSIEVFLSKMHDTNKIWLFGEKGGEKTTFVENFSLIRRKEFIRAGMCNERINQYGGMSQELRERFASQGFEFIYVPEAKAEQMSKGSLSPAKRDGIIKMKNLLYKIDL